MWLNLPSAAWCCHTLSKLLGLITEFLTLDIVAGLLAAVVAMGIGYGLAVYVLDLLYHLNLWV
jgi:predicted lysophospholipase L1 biosynthesis ABC-type transport system permease subunit